MSLRTPARTGYDALIELGPSQAARPVAYALVKRTYAIGTRSCLPAPARPLLHDLRDPELSPRFPPGSDFWPSKAATDFAVQGSAHAPTGSPVSQMEVSARIGDVSKRIAVFGHREVRWGREGSPFIGEPRPLERMALTWENAYGGTDRRVRPRGAVPPASVFAAALGLDHPGTYPRNPLGKGYAVPPWVNEVTEMPNLEDPEDLLTAERLVVGDASLWHRQPLPACFEWTTTSMFPRYVWFHGAEAWYPGPQDDALPEVRLGLLPTGYRDGRIDGVDPRFFQEASPRFVVLGIRGNEDVAIAGMSAAGRSLDFRLPGPPPSLVFKLEGRSVEVEARTHSVLVEPDAARLSIVYGASVELHRRFIPGVHKHIPVGVSVDGDDPIWYVAPPTTYDLLGGRYP